MIPEGFLRFPETKCRSFPGQTKTLRPLVGPPLGSLTPRKLNSSPLNNDGWFWDLFGMVYVHIFSGANC